MYTITNNKTDTMETTGRTSITVEATVHAPLDKVWELWTGPHHITQWTNASDDWHAPRAENDLREGGKFNTRMEAKDGSFGFDFEGEYTTVNHHELIAYKLGDDRRVQISFRGDGDTTLITETFDAEGENPIEMQRGGWQAILNNFKRYAEAN